MIEVLIVAVFLAGIGLSSAYYFTQTKVAMSSSSQVLQCQTIAKQALENVVSLGTRLYGYQINSKNTQLKYNPLFIKKDPAKNYGDAGNIEDVGDGSALNFPDLYAKLFKDLISQTANTSLVNTGVDIVKETTGLTEIAPSVMLINSVNALQYLYNSDLDYFKGNPDPDNSNKPMGKDWTVSSSMSDDWIPALWKQYKDQFNLKNVKLYVKVAPVDLEDNQVLEEADVNSLNTSQGLCQKTQYDGTQFVTTGYSCPENPTGHKLILTRPRLSDPSDSSIRDEISTDLRLVGNDDIGFEIKVMLKYERNDQEFSCDAMRTFSHQLKTFTKTMTNNVFVTLSSLTSGAGENLLASGLKKTSCNTHSPGSDDYKDITMELNFNEFSGTSRRAGAMFLCKAQSACRSYGEGGYGSCTVQTDMTWQRCHNFKFPGQGGSTDSVLLSSSRDSKLRLTFNDLPENRRYDLYVIENSMLESSGSPQRAARFYIDAKRPKIENTDVDEDVGLPTDNNKGRNYKGHRPGVVSWLVPSGIASTGKWLQCNQADVDFESDVEDQFTHNFEDCEAEAIREDGNGIDDVTSNVSISDRGSDSEKCNGTLAGIQHGRQKVTLRPADSCEKGTVRDIVWDTDLPGTFSPQDFSSTEYWFKSSSSPRYVISTKVPATGAGKFPKHYTVDCFEEYWSNAEGTRPDGNGGSISCDLTTVETDVDDGCNPFDMGADYWHVCGSSKQNKQTKWAVYAPQGESCANVQCEPDLICCENNGSSGQNCTNDICYAQVSNPECTNPKGGSSQDSSSGCSDLGLYSCTYSLPCDATSPCSESGPTSACSGKRQGNSCSYTRSESCVLNNTSWNSSCQSAGTYACGGGSCTVGCTSRCSHDEYRTKSSSCSVTQSGTCTSGVCSVDSSSCTGTSCSVTTTGTCTPNGGTNWQSTSPSTAGTCSVDSSSCTADTESQCGGTEYKAQSQSQSVTFSGACGAPSGSCTKKGVGGGNLSQERCEVDTSNKTRMPAVCSSNCGSAVNGQCNTTHYDCTAGDSQNAIEERDKWTWECAGINGGTTASCEELKPVACGSPDSIDCSNITANNSACDVGTPENCSETSLAWTWDCKNGTQITTPPCSKSKQPVCGPNPCDCNVGNLKTSTCPDPSTAASWVCENGGTEVICPDGGQPKCGPDPANPKHNQCHVGDAENENEETHKWTWDCKNDNRTTNCVEGCTPDYTSKGACENNLPAHQQCQTKPLPGNPSCWERVDGTSECKCKHYGCKVGTSPPNSQSEESHGWEWQCVNGSKTVDCTEPKPTTCCTGQPQCGPNSTNPTHYNCRKGEAQSSGGAEGAYIWECHCDGNKVDCVECKPGYFKTEALCNADSNKPNNSTCKVYDGGCYKWECDSGYIWDENTGTCDSSPACECADNNTANATCGGNSSPNALNPTCCAKGYFHSHPADTDTEWKWTCAAESSGGGTRVCQSNVSCSKTKSVSVPDCGTGGSNCAGQGHNNTAGCCDAGVFHPHPADTDTEWKWTCKISLTDNSGNVECSAPIPLTPECGTGGPNCAGSGSDGAAGCCDAGVFHGAPGDTITELKWTCKISLTDNSGNVECSIPKPQCSCDPSTYATFQEGAAWADAPRWRLNPNGGCSSGCHKINNNAPEESRLERNRHAPSDEDSFEHVDVHRWTCTGTGYQNSERCEWSSRLCQGAQDNCLEGCPFGRPSPNGGGSFDCSVDNQEWPGYICLTSSAASDCVYSVCDRRRIAGCRCQTHACHQPASP